jgi:maltooligosyltrehalose synthase
VPRLIATLTPDGRAPLGPSVWGDTRINMAGGRALRNIFTGAVLTPERAGSRYFLETAAVLERFPVALLVPVGFQISEFRLQTSTSNF